MSAVAPRARRASAVVAVALLAAAACVDKPPAQAPTPDPLPPAPTSAEVTDETAGLAPARRIAVAVYFPSRASDGLDGEVNEIFDTTAAGDRAKQILMELISGPSRADLLSVLPPGTHLRQVYVTADGTAWVDFSDELKTGLGGGSFQELLTVYSVVDSVVFNVPEIRRVGFLIDGQPIDTLNGHVDLTRPLRPDRSIIVSGKTADAVGTVAGLRP